MKSARLLGFIFVASGIFSFVSSFVSITGFVIADEVGQIRTVAGIILIVVGTVLIYLGRNEEGP